MTCFMDARCCIKYHIHVLYNSLNKHTRYIEYQSYRPPKYTWWLSHPPLSIESPASRRKMWVLREAMWARDDWPFLYDKLAMSNTCQILQRSTPYNIVKNGLPWKRVFRRRHLGRRVTAVTCLRWPTVRKSYCNISHSIEIVRFVFKKVPIKFQKETTV